MSDFRWIALALTVTAGCQVYDRVPWGRCWGWLTAKALALRSWIWADDSEFFGHERPRPLTAAEFKSPVMDAEDWHWVSYPRQTTPAQPSTITVTTTAEAAPRRRPSRASAAKARKAKK